MGTRIEEHSTVAMAWTCPVCGKGVAPSEKTCDHGGGLYAVDWRKLGFTGAAQEPPSYQAQMRAAGINRHPGKQEN